MRLTPLQASEARAALLASQQCPLPNLSRTVSSIRRVRTDARRMSAASTDTTADAAERTSTEPKTEASSVPRSAHSTSFVAVR